MNILLTGGVGHIGSHMAVAMAQVGHHVVLYDNLCNSSVSTIDRMSNIAGQQFTFVLGDVRDVELLRNTLRAYHIEAVVHFAGLKAVGESVLIPLDYYSNNVGGIIGLVQSMQSTGVRTLVFSSSATAYGAPCYLPIDEAHPTCANSPYGRTKLQSEHILADVAQSDPTWRIACLRYLNPVGAHESGLIGECPPDIPNNLLPYVADVAAGKLPYLNVFGSDYATLGGTGVRDYIHVMDLAEGHLEAMQFLNRQTGWHAINLSTGRGYSVLEMIKAFETASGKPVPYKISPRRPGDIATCYADTRKASDQLNWHAKRTLAQMCESSWLWQSRRTASK